MLKNKRCGIRTGDIEKPEDNNNSSQENIADLCESLQESPEDLEA